MMTNPNDLVGGLAAIATMGVVYGGCAYAAMWPTSQLFGRTLIASRRPDEIALTFDDGPNPRWTPQLLEILAQHDVRATFFLIGCRAATQRSLVREMHSAGHLIGNHTWTHPNMALTGIRKNREELSRTNAELESILGSPVRYFRPPFGGRRPATLRIARELGLIPVTWNAMTTDWSTPTAEPIAASLIQKIERNRSRGYASNIVLHDSSHTSLELSRSASTAATGKLLERYRKSRQFVTLDAWLDM